MLRGLRIDLTEKQDARISKEAQIFGVGAGMFVAMLFMIAIQQTIAGIVAAWVAGLFLAVGVHIRSNKVRAKKP